MSHFGVLILILTLLGDQKVCGKLPPFIQTCNRNDPNMAFCIINSINNLKPIFMSKNLGPRYESLPKIEPVYFHSVSIGNRPDFKAHLSNMMVRGFSNFEIEKLSVNMNDLTFHAIVRFPRLDMFAKYNLVFNLFGLALHGKGDGSNVVDNSRVRFQIKARRVLGPNGLEYLQFDKFDIKIKFGTINKSSYSSLFNGRTQIFEDIANQIVRAQPDFMRREVYPPLENLISNYCTAVANKFSTMATFDEIFPY